MKQLEPAAVRSILVISLSNIGDVVLTFPVIDILCADFPHATVSVVTGPKAAPLLEGNPALDLRVYDKHLGFSGQVRWVAGLRRQRFDLVVDLRNSALPFLIRAGRRTPPWMRRSLSGHMRRQHLKRLESVYPFPVQERPRAALVLPSGDKEYIGGLVRDYAGGRPLAVIAPGAADEKKRWSEDGFAGVADYLAGQGAAVVLAGDAADAQPAARVSERMHGPALDLCGRTTLRQLACLLDRCALAVVNDSAPMHLASYLDKPVVAVFGPTDPARYGPWSRCAAVAAGEPATPDGRKRPVCETVTLEEVLAAFRLDNGRVLFPGEGSNARDV